MGRRCVHCIAAALCFVKSGRHSKWEEKVRGDDNNTIPTTKTTTTKAIEMGTVQHEHNDCHLQEQQATAAATTVFATGINHGCATYSTAESIVLLEITNKVDNV